MVTRKSGKQGKITNKPLSKKKVISETKDSQEKEVKQKKKSQTATGEKSARLRFKTPNGDIRFHAGHAYVPSPRSGRGGPKATI